MSDPLFFDNRARSGKNLKQAISSANPYILGFLSIGMIAIIGLSIWIFYPETSVDDEALPVIYADTTPIRVKPDDSELVASSNYNSRIYETFGQPRTTQRIENILKPAPRTEQPISREELFTGLRTQPDTNVIQVRETPANSMTDSEPTTENITATTQISPQENITTEPENITFRTPEKKKIPVDVVVPSKPAMPQIFDSQNQATTNITSQDIQKAKTAEPAAGNLVKPINKPKPTYQAQPTGNFYVQLASIRDSSRASESWGKLTKKHAILNSASYRTQAADIPGKGTFYRIQAGPMNKNEAAELCRQVQEQGGSCFVTSK